MIPAARLLKVAIKKLIELLQLKINYKYSNFILFLVAYIVGQAYSGSKVLASMSAKG